MNLQNIENNAKNPHHKSSYSEMDIGKDTYHVTSVFMGNKQLGMMLETLAVRHILDEIGKYTQEILQS